MLRTLLPKENGKPKGCVCGMLPSSVAVVICNILSACCCRFCCRFLGGFAISGCLPFAPQTPEGNYKPKINAKSADPARRAGSGVQGAKTKDLRPHTSCRWEVVDAGRAPGAECQCHILCQKCTHSVPSALPIM